ncbi:radical SAM protein [Sphaerisporangium album]|uniref:Radical SAM protein n=1 Tax=Sphaerisporangium album TaxID=509200 RepID=A0A367EIJ7_9ACTN|nr:radical SAM protein [Sphaerisporangium album]
MRLLHSEINAIQAREIVLGPPYDLSAKTMADPLRLVFLLPYGHEFSLLCMGPLALYDLINRSPDVPAAAERAIVYDCLHREGNRLLTPDGQPYRSIESAVPVGDADILGVSITHAGDLVSLIKLLDLAGVPRRSAERRHGIHPLVVGGNGGFANPEVMADYLDVVALGEGERSVIELTRILHANRGADRHSVLEQLAQVPGLYVPGLYDCDFAPGGGVKAIRPRTPAAPEHVTPQYLKVTDLHPAHFVAPISDGQRGMMIPTLGCRHTCNFCTLGVPDFRQAPLQILQEYLELLERHHITQVVVSSPTFTQYKHHCELLELLGQFAQRTGGQVSTIIGSVRADELTPRYLDAVAKVGDYGHLFTELQLSGTPRGIVTIAPEFARDDLVKTFGKTMTRQRVNKALDLLAAHPHVGHIMLYFIVGAPGEHEDDRLSIADYAVEVFERLGRSDGTVIVKLQQFMPKPGTPSQRLSMADPGLIDGYVEQIRRRLRALVGQQAYQKHYRVLWGESSRLYLESVCLRGDRRIGPVLEELHDSGADLSQLSGDQLREALSAHGLQHERFLRAFSMEETLPWAVVDTVDFGKQARLLAELERRANRSPLPESCA